MNKNVEKPKVVVIVGPTASGKTSLSIELALQCSGEIISADSRQVYQGLDIGTGKVTKEEMKGIPHHLLDVCSPQETYTVADFVRDGRNAVDDILNRNKLPIIVGGTFFYIDALLGKISAPDVEPNEALRLELEQYTIDELHKKLEALDSERAHALGKENKRRLIRAIEVADALGSVPVLQSDELYESLTIGISIPKETLVQNIHTRLVTRLDAGMIEEVESLHKNGLSYEKLAERGIEYRYISEYLQDKITREEMCAQIETKSWQYAKRQITWLKRDKKILWFAPTDLKGIAGALSEFLK